MTDELLALSELGNWKDEEGSDFTSSSKVSLVGIISCEIDDIAADSFSSQTSSMMF